MAGAAGEERRAVALAAGGVDHAPSIGHGEREVVAMPMLVPDLARITGNETLLFLSHRSIIPHCRGAPMERKKASDFRPEVMELFDGFVHGRLSRRDFLDRAGAYAVGGFTAAAMLEALSPNFAWAQQVSKDDARIKAGYVDFDSPQGSGRMRAYMAQPAKAGKAPGVVVIHENRGLNPYIEDVARRLATEGYLALAPDALAPAGGYPGDEDKGRAAFAKLDPKKAFEDLAAAVPYLKRHPECAGKVGAIGFCFGGGIVNQLAVRFAE